MKNKIVIAFSLVFLGLLVPVPASAFSLFGGPCQDAPNNPVCPSSTTPQDPVIHVINLAANLIALIAGIAAVIMIIISGFNLVTSGGNTEAVTKARQRIIGALVGLVLVALAWILVRFITDVVIK